MDCTSKTKRQGREVATNCSNFQSKDLRLASCQAKEFGPEETTNPVKASAWRAVIQVENQVLEVDQVTGETKELVVKRFDTEPRFPEMFELAKHSFHQMALINVTDLNTHAFVSGMVRASELTYRINEEHKVMVADTARNLRWTGLARTDVGGQEKAKACPRTSRIAKDWSTESQPSPNRRTSGSSRGGDPLRTISTELRTINKPARKRHRPASIAHGGTAALAISLALITSLLLIQPSDAEIMSSSIMEQNFDMEVVRALLLAMAVTDKRLSNAHIGVVSTVANPIDGNIKMILTNPTDAPVRIHAGMHVALANELRQSEEGPWLEEQKRQGSAKGEDLRKLKQLCEEFADVFSKSQYDLGSCLVGEHDIITTTEEPLSTKPRRTPFRFREEVRDHMEKWLKTGVMKKDGGLRPCIDFRKLNEVTVPDHFPLPRLEVVLEKVGNCHWYTSLDLSSGFLQIRLTERASRKCGLITEDDVFQMTHMPFGLRNATIEPLTKLTRKEIPFTWESEQQIAFDEIKKILCEKPVLRFPDYTKPFHIFTDASNVGQGGGGTKMADSSAYLLRKADAHPNLARWAAHDCCSEERVKNLKELEDIAEFPACLSLSLESQLVMDESVNVMTLRGADGNPYTVDLKLEQKADHEATAFETAEMPEGMNETEKESCNTCQLRHMPTPAYRAEMKLPQSNTLFAKVGLDLAGPFPITEKVPVQDAKATTLVKAFLSNCYLKFGGCTELITDNATAFTSEFFREFCSMLYISKRYATPHWSQGNAITERCFRTFHNIMAKYISPDQPDFDEHLDMVTFDQMLDPRTAHAPMATDLAEFKMKLVSSLRSAWEATAAECADAQLRAKAQYDKLVRVLEAQLVLSQTSRMRKEMPSKRRGQKKCKTWRVMTIMAKQYPLNLNPSSSQRRRKLCHGTLTI
uniref:Integrase catalytic domain-containing protein n=1 Tax=Globodera pallida TaxID=36090 RepID=A0A183BRH0_GLOPA